MTDIIQRPTNPIRTAEDKALYNKYYYQTHKEKYNKRWHCHVCGHSTVNNYKIHCSGVKHRKKERLLTQQAFPMKSNEVP
jgi:ABC-type ATPase with predicted acetyltransferase domain